MVQNAHLQLIDFDEVGRGHRYQDLGSFVGQMVWNAVRDPACFQQVTSGTEALVAGYARHMGAIDQSLLRASIATGILRCMPHPFRRGLSDWPGKMLQMFACANQWFATASLTARQRLAEPIDPSKRTNLEDCVPVECRPYLDCQLVEDHWQHDCVKIIHARLLRHKPGRRLLVDYTIQSDTSDDKRSILGKARFTKKVDSRVLKLHCDLQVLRVANVHVPRVIATVPSLNMWLQEKLPGKAVCPGSDKNFHRMVGTALAKLHLSATTVDRNIHWLMSFSRSRCNIAQWLTNSTVWRTTAQAVLELAQHSASRLEATAPVLLHRDFYFDQVLVDEQTVALLDLDLAAMGPAELDIGNYLAHLDEAAIRHGRCESEYAVQAEAFLEGYLVGQPNVSLGTLWSGGSYRLPVWRPSAKRITSRSHATHAILQATLSQGAIAIPRACPVDRSASC